MVDKLGPLDWSTWLPVMDIFQLLDTWTPEKKRKKRGKKKRKSEVFVNSGFPWETTAVAESLPKTRLANPGRIPSVDRFSSGVAGPVRDRQRAPPLSHRPFCGE